MKLLQQANSHTGNGKQINWFNSWAVTDPGLLLEMKILKLDNGDFQTTVNILKTTEMSTLNGWNYGVWITSQ